MREWREAHALAIARWAPCATEPTSGRGTEQQHVREPQNVCGCTACGERGRDTWQPQSACSSNLARCKQHSVQLRSGSLSTSLRRNPPPTQTPPLYGYRLGDRRLYELLTFIIPKREPRHREETIVLASRARRDRPSLLRDPSGYTTYGGGLKRVRSCDSRAYPALCRRIQSVTCLLRAASTLISTMAERQLPVLDAQHEHTAGLLAVGAVNADVNQPVVACAPRRNYC